MSSSGWGGPGNEPQGGPWQQGSGQPGGPYGTPSPGWQSPPPRRGRSWALLAVAFSCVLALLLVVGGGITYLALRQNADESSVATGSPSASITEDVSPSDDASPDEEVSPTPEKSETSSFEVVVPYDPPTGTVDELWDVMADNPLSEGSLPALSTCELPATPIEPDDAELQAVLDAASTCLNQVWATASSDRGLPWTSPEIVVYHHPDVPKEATCSDGFAADFPRVCNLDSTIYWPDGYGTGRDLEDAADVPAAYLWDLSYLYMNTVTWNSSLAVYYGTMSTQLEETDDERHDEAWRRYNLQNQCLASAASMQVPSAAEPSKQLRDILTSPDTWEAGQPPKTITPENRALWIQRGFEADGDLSACNTWTADLEQVT